MINSIGKQLFIPVLLALLLPACVSAPYPPSLERGEAIAIQAPSFSGLDITVDSKATKTGKGVVLGAAGALGGAALGGVTGAIAGFSCGPLFIVCGPVAAAAGIVIGGVGGGAAGAVYGGRGGISGDKAKQFNEITAQLIDADKLELQLHDRLSASISERWIVDRDSSNTVALNIKSLYFEQGRKEFVRLVFDSEMEVHFGGKTSRVKYKHVGAPRYVDDWLADDGKRFQSEIDAAIENVTHTMVGKLASGA